jgi:tetratricopeptide (TPR) repeat protein
MVTVASFVDALYKSFSETAGLDTKLCEFHEASGQLIIAGDKTRVVPVASLFPPYLACQDAAAQKAFTEAVTEAFVHGTSDVPEGYSDCSTRLLPQLWTIEKISARKATLPEGHDLPNCGIHGEDSPSQVHNIGVVLVCEYMHPGGALPPIETPVLSSDLARWGVSFVDALKKALDNLRTRTKESLPAEKRWEHHPTGCAQSCWHDRFDAARAALLSKLVTQRKRPDGQPEAGGHVIALASTSVVIASVSKNALGLCFMGDTLHLKMAAQDKASKANQMLSTTPFRLVKMKDASGVDAPRHPLDQKASEGFVYRWLPYSPGGPPLRQEGEFSVPIDQGEVDAILNAAEAGQKIPVFKHDESSGPSKFQELKDKGNALFKTGEFVKAIVAYDAALATKPAPSDKDASIVHSNAAQAMLNLARDSAEKREGCAAEAMKRALIATQLDPTNAKAHARCAGACDILGEKDAAAEARAKADACLATTAAAEAATKEARLLEAQKEKEAKQAAKAKKDELLAKEAAREALLARERALEQEKWDAEAASKKAETSSAKKDISEMLKDAKIAELLATGSKPQQAVGMDKVFDVGACTKA